MGKIQRLEELEAWKEARKLAQMIFEKIINQANKVTALTNGLISSLLEE